MVVGCFMVIINIIKFTFVESDWLLVLVIEIPLPPWSPLLLPLLVIRENMLFVSVISAWLCLIEIR